MIYEVLTEFQFLRNAWEGYSESFRCVYDFLYSC